MGIRQRVGFSYTGFHPITRATITIQPSNRDSYLSEGQANTNFGSELFMFVRDYAGALKNARMVVNFPLSSIPAGARILEATLQLYNYDGQAADEGQVVWAYKLTRTDWVEAQVTWNNYKAGSPWTTPGGDYVTSSPAGGSLTLPDTVGGAGWLEWIVTDIVDDAWSNSIDVNIVLRLESEPEQNPLKAPLFYTRNYAVDTTLRPKLEVVYRP